MSNIDLGGNTLVNGFFSGTPTQKGYNNEVYIALRTDAPATAAGTKEDPFDGSTPAKLDTLLAALPADTSVNFGPGVFQTTTGITMKDNWIIRGEGMYLTVIQATTARVEVGGGAVIYGDSPTHLVVEDIGIDGNFPDPTVGPWAIAAINLFGGMATVRRCHVFNCSCNYAAWPTGDNPEAFLIYLGFGNPTVATAGWGIAQDNVIEKCTSYGVDAAHSAYLDGIYITGGWDGYVGRIERNIFRKSPASVGPDIAWNVLWCDAAYVTDNVSFGGVFNSDTGGTNGLWIARNNFLEMTGQFLVQIGGGILPTGPGGYPLATSKWLDVVVEDNLFHMVGGDWQCGMQIASGVTNGIIRNNVFKGTPPSSGAQKNIVNEHGTGGYPISVTFQENLIDPAMERCSVSFTTGEVEYINNRWLNGLPFVGSIDEQRAPKVLLVDATVGTDDRSLIYADFNVPFQTIAAAEALATSGDTIRVQPGTYTDYNLGKNGIVYEGMPGAHIILPNVSGTMPGNRRYIFGDAPNNVSTAMTFTVLWNGQLSNRDTGGVADIYGIYVGNAGTQVTYVNTWSDRVNNQGLIAGAADSTVNGGVGIYSVGTVNATGDIYGGGTAASGRSYTGAAVYCAGGTLTLEAGKIDAGWHGIGLLCTAGTLYANCQRLGAGPYQFPWGCGIYGAGGTVHFDGIDLSTGGIGANAGTLYLRGETNGIGLIGTGVCYASGICHGGLYAEATALLDFEGTVFGAVLARTTNHLRLRGRVVVATGSPVIASLNGTNAIILDHATLVAQDGSPSIAMDGITTAATVMSYSSFANTAPVNGITVNVSTLTVNSSVA